MDHGTLSSSSVSSTDSCKYRGRGSLRRSSTLLDGFKIPEMPERTNPLRHYTQAATASSKRKKMMQRSMAVISPDAASEKKDSSWASSLGIKSNVRARIKHFQQKSQSLDLDMEHPLEGQEGRKSDAKLRNHDCYNRVKQKAMRKCDSIDQEAGLVEDEDGRSEVRRLNQWLLQKSFEQEDSGSLASLVDRKRKKLMRSHSTVTERKTLLPQSAFQSFESARSVESLVEEIQKLTIEAEVHHATVDENKPKGTMKVTASNSDILLEASLIGTEGRLVKLASIDELNEYEQGEKK